MQVIGFIYIKKSRDPLQGLDKLEYLKVMSKIQKLTPEFLPKLLELEEWKDLEDLEKD